MKKKQFRKSEVKDLNNSLKNRYLVEDLFDKKTQLFFVEDDGVRVVMLDNEALFFYDDEVIVPTLKALRMEKLKEVLKKITVDMGAVKFVSKGADIMRPGITEVEDGIGTDEYIVVVDENNKMPLSVCRTMFSGQQIKDMDSGKVLKNIHFVGDKIWNFK